MRKLLPLIILLTVTFSLFAQDLRTSRSSSYFTYIFKLTEQQASEVYQKGMSEVADDFFANLVDSFPTDKHYGDSLPLGNYLYVKSVKNMLNLELKSVNNIDVKILNNNQDLAIVVHDSLGNNISLADVRLGTTKIKYDSKTNTFRLTKTNRQGLLKVTYHGHASYFNINREVNYSKFRRTATKILYRTPVKFVAVPVRVVCGIPMDLARSIYRGRFCGVFWYIKKPFADIYNSISYGEPTGFVQKIGCWFHKYDCENFKGYLVFNKPKYLPGDTVFLKAYVLTSKNKPVKDSLALVLKGNENKTIAWLKPYRPGAYKYQLVLDKKLNLKLDKYYNLALEYDFVTLMSGSFRFEEYDLKSTTYELRSEKTDYIQGDQVALYCKGTDENGLNLPDSRVELCILSKEVDKYFKNRLFVPDTLWKHAQNLDPLGETKIIVPDSIFPDATLDFSVEAKFLNSSNELQQKTLRLSRNYDPHKITFDLKNDSLYIDYKYRGKLVVVKALLDAENLFEDKSITLPYREKINAFASEYDVYLDSTSESFELNEKNAGLQCTSNRNKDSVWFSIANPRKVPLSYSIFRKNKLIYSGNGSNPEFTCKSTTNDNYFASVQYIWGGKVLSDDYVIPSNRSKLNVRMFGPEVIYPGQKTKISISVTDADGKPVSDVDLTAFANTKKFNSTSVPTLPYLGKSYPARFRYNAFHANSNRFQLQSVKQLDWKHWNPLMKLDSIELYKFLYPKNGLYQCSFARRNKDFAEISPLLVDSGKFLPVNILYIDGYPVYFNITTPDQPYVFSTSEGWHKVKMRTLKYEVETKVYLKRGFKTILSINPGITTNKDFTVVKKPTRYEWNEYSLANNTLMSVKKNFGGDFTVIRQNDKVVLLSDYKSNWFQNYIVGPFKRTNLTFENLGKFSNTLEFEQGFNYEFTPGLVKMRSEAPFISPDQPMDSRLPNSNFNDSVYTYSDVVSYWQTLVDERQSVKPQYKNVMYTEPGKGTLKVEYSVNPDISKELVKNYLLFSYKTNDYTRVYPGNDHLIYGLEPGYYKLLVLLMNNNYFVADSIVVKANGTNYCLVSPTYLDFEDSYSKKINEIIRSRTLQLPDITDDKGDLKKINAITNVSVVRYNNASSVSGEVVDAATNEPLIGVSVQVQGTSIGAITDIEGHFTIEVPSTHQVLVFSYLGYMVESFNVGKGANIRVQLVADMKKLDEIVVIGYGTSPRRGFSVPGVSEQALQGQLAGVSVNNEPGADALVRIRGISTITSSASPMIVMDGVPYTGSLNDLKPEDIQHIEVLKSESATAIYGSRAANGVILISSKKGITSSVIRNLAHNQTFLEGLSQSNSLRSRFSDYAYWKPDLVTNDKGIASFDVTFPDDVTAWKTYVLAMGNRTSGQVEGEIKSFKPVMATLATTKFLVAGDRVNLLGKALNYTSDSIVVKTNFEIDGKPQYIKEGKILISRIDTLCLAIPQKDSLQIKYTLQKEDGYADGELRNIPVFPVGTIETKGLFCTLNKDTTVTYRFDKSFGKVIIHAEASLLNVVLDEVKHIRNYGYLCNEQLASKLKAMLLERKVYQLMNKEYSHPKDIQKMIKLLEEHVNSDSLWGWWKSCDTQWWITLHAAEALIQAKKEGFKVNANFRLLPPRLLQQYEKLYYRDKISVVRLLKTIDSISDYKSFIDKIYVGSTDTVGRYELMELKQSFGLPFNRDILLSERKTTLFGNAYWGQEGYSLSDDAISATLVAYRILRKDNPSNAMLPGIVNYFLERRGSGQWRNTFESCRILEAILPDMVRNNQISKSPTLGFTGALDSSKVVFPFTCEIRPEKSLTISKKGNAPVYFTVYQQFANTSPEPVDKDFTVTTSFEGNNNMLQAGKPVKLIATVSVKKTAEYVMIEIPIPAGCSYNEKNSTNGNESYREYYKEKVSIFCTRLPQGKYVFEVNLLPRYNGVYHLNPAKAELMYFPVFFGREGMKEVTIQ